MIIKSTIDKLGEFENLRAKQTKEKIKVVVIKPKSQDDVDNPEYYIEEIPRIVKKLNPDIAIAPYNSFHPDVAFLKSQRTNFLEKLVSGVKDSGALVIPGTFFWRGSKNDGTSRYNAYGSNPIIFEDEVLEYFRQRLDPDSMNRIAYTRIVKNPNLTEGKGNQKGVFKWKGWNIGFENCADHGSLAKLGFQDKIDLQMVLAYNLGGVVHSSPLPGGSAVVAKPNGYVLYYDSFKKFPEAVELMKFEGKDKTKFSWQDGIRKDNAYEFELTLPR